MHSKRTGRTFWAAHEGEGYARFFNENGIAAFVCEYRVSPHRFPLPLQDARRAVQYVRYHAEEYGIDKNKVAIMGSSAGGHLAALTATYFEPIALEDSEEIDQEDFIPNAQILCYPVIKMSVDKSVAHPGSCINLLGLEQLPEARNYSPENLVSERTPQCFMWHTMEDAAVPVANSIDYLKALREKNIPADTSVIIRCIGCFYFRGI